MDKYTEKFGVMKLLFYIPTMFLICLFFKYKTLLCERIFSVIQIKKEQLHGNFFFHQIDTLKNGSI